MTARTAAEASHSVRANPAVTQNSWRPPSTLRTVESRMS